MNNSRCITSQTGDLLSPEDQRYAKSAFVHRFTKDHRPEWKNRKDCASCPVAFASDNDWLAHTLFDVFADGAMCRTSRFIRSYPTWPDNPELRRPD